MIIYVNLNCTGSKRLMNRFFRITTTTNTDNNTSPG